MNGICLFIVYYFVRLRKLIVCNKTLPDEEVLEIVREKNIRNSNKEKNDTTTTTTMIDETRVLRNCYLLTGARTRVVVCVRAILRDNIIEQKNKIFIIILKKKTYFPRVRM